MTSEHSQIQPPAPYGQQEQNPQLCRNCRVLFNTQALQEVTTSGFEKPNAESEDKSRKIEISRYVEETATAGCRVCSLLVNYLSRAEREAMREHWERSKQALAQFVSTLELYIDGKRPPFLSMYHELPMKEGRGDVEREVQSLVQLFPTGELEPHVNFGQIESNTGSEGSWKIASRWINSCVSDHVECNCSSIGPITLPPLPKRVIDVGQSDDNDIAPRLYQTIPTTPPSRYVTLSHCWGTQMPLRLLSSNFTTLCKRIPVSTLPQTFRDAIAITRRLGVRYIWIDSLCIIQDSETDWQEQAALMSSIYSTSFCNIAAAHASDSREGCFIDRNPELVKPIQVHIGWGPQPGLYYAVKCYFWSQNVSEAPLNRRAWVCQERLLAPRNLYFGETQLYFECGEMMACEAFPLGLPIQIGGRNYSENRISLRKIIARSRNNVAPHTQLPPLTMSDIYPLFSMWNSIVYNYSSGALSHEEDKLIAISGLASEIQEDPGTEDGSGYIAGMWRNHLASQLLWQVRRLEKPVPRTRPVEYRAPTWSWASMIGKIEHACQNPLLNQEDVVCRDLDAEVELVTGNPFGQIKRAVLRLSAPLAKEWIRIEEDKDNRGSFSLWIKDQRAGSALLDEDSIAGETVSYEGCYYYLPIRCIPDDRSKNLRNGEDLARITVLPAMSGIILRNYYEPDEQKRLEFVRVGQFDFYGPATLFKQVCQRFEWESGGKICEIEVGLNGEWGRWHRITIF